LYQPQFIPNSENAVLPGVENLGSGGTYDGRVWYRQIFNIPTNGNMTGIEENDESSGYLVHLERICLVFEGAEQVTLSRFLQKLIESRLGMMSDPRSARWHIEITKQTRFSLTIPPT